MHRKRAEDFGRFEKVEIQAWTRPDGFVRRGRGAELRIRLRTGMVDFWGSLRPDEFVGYGRHTCCRRRGDGKASIERLCISLPYVETLNSKVIKGFVPELRSCYVFFVFRDSYVLCNYVMNILCTFHISVSWVWCTNICSPPFLPYLFFFFF